jgi:ABC-type sugar transport system permease subunit
VLPLLRPALVTALIFVTIWSLRAFDAIYVLTGGGPGDATVILNWTAYAQAFQYGDFGRASALGVLIALVTLGWTLAYLRLAGREPGT